MNDNVNLTDELNQKNKKIKQMAILGFLYLIDKLKKQILSGSYDFSYYLILVQQLNIYNIYIFF